MMAAAVVQAPVVPPTTAPPGRRYPDKIERWRPLVARHFPADQVDRAMAVMAWESGGEPAARGDRTLVCLRSEPTVARQCREDGKRYGDSHGLFQIRHLRGRPSPDALRDPETNVAYAAKMLASKNGRWSPTWTGATKQGIR